MTLRNLEKQNICELDPFAVRIYLSMKFCAYG